MDRPLVTNLFRISCRVALFLASFPFLQITVLSALDISSPETARAGAPAPRETRGADLALEDAAGESHHGRVPKDEEASRRGSALLSFELYELTTYNAAQRAQAASLTASPPPQRQ